MSGRWDLPALILMSDERRLPDPLANPGDAAKRLPPGAAVLVRHTDARARSDLAHRLAPVCRAQGLTLIVSDDLALAEACGAEGLHLPERAATSGRAMAIRRRWRGILTVAAHGPRALARASALGADAALVSPVFETQSHPGQPAAGLMRFLTWSRMARLPIYALGGITAANAGRLYQVNRGQINLVGIAGIDGFR
jgi:thiamine-phosphate pyrophosphorylase